MGSVCNTTGSCCCLIGHRPDQSCTVRTGTYRMHQDSAIIYARQRHLRAAIQDVRAGASDCSSSGRGGSAVRRPAAVLHVLLFKATTSQTCVRSAIRQHDRPGAHARVLNSSSHKLANSDPAAAAAPTASNARTAAATVLHVYTVSAAGSAWAVPVCRAAAVTAAIATSQCSCHAVLKVATPTGSCSAYCPLMTAFLRP